ncbi:unnamed protein product [Amoebophrya sp. A120]|nr:unnamed protein product [Amoebophrya sp. A120]|eukprot:GSA120T00011969001.1
MMEIKNLLLVVLLFVLVGTTRSTSTLTTTSPVFSESSPSPASRPFLRRSRARGLLLQKEHSEDLSRRTTSTAPTFGRTRTSSFLAKKKVPDTSRHDHGDGGRAGARRTSSSLAASATTSIAVPATANKYKGEAVDVVLARQHSGRFSGGAKPAATSTGTGGRNPTASSSTTSRSTSSSGEQDLLQLHEEGNKEVVQKVVDNRSSSSSLLLNNDDDELGRLVVMAPKDDHLPHDNQNSGGAGSWEQDGPPPKEAGKEREQEESPASGGGSLVPAEKSSTGFSTNKAPTSTRKVLCAKHCGHRAFVLVRPDRENVVCELTLQDGVLESRAYCIDRCCYDFFEANAHQWPTATSRDGTKATSSGSDFSSWFLEDQLSREQQTALAQTWPSKILADLKGLAELELQASSAQKEEHLHSGAGPQHHEDGYYDALDGSQELEHSTHDLNVEDFSSPSSSSTTSGEDEELLQTPRNNILDAPADHAGLQDDTTSEAAFKFRNKIMEAPAVAAAKENGNPVQKTPISMKKDKHDDDEQEESPDTSGGAASSRTSSRSDKMLPTSITTPVRHHQQPPQSYPAAVTLLGGGSANNPFTAKLVSLADSLFLPDDGGGIWSGGPPTGINMHAPPETGTVVFTSGRGDGDKVQGAFPAEGVQEGGLSDGGQGQGLLLHGAVAQPATTSDSTSSQNDIHKEAQGEQDLPVSGLGLYIGLLLGGVVACSIAVCIYIRCCTTRKDGHHGDKKKKKDDKNKPGAVKSGLRSRFQPGYEDSEEALRRESHALKKAKKKGTMSTAELQEEMDKNVRQTLETLGLTGAASSIPIEIGSPKRNSQSGGQQSVNSYNYMGAASPSSPGGATTGVTLDSSMDSKYRETEQYEDGSAMTTEAEAAPSRTKKNQGLAIQHQVIMDEQEEVVFVPDPPARNKKLGMQHHLVMEEQPSGENTMEEDDD